MRLKRIGRKHDYVYRVVVTDSRSGPQSGKEIEVIGSYDPRKDWDTIDTDRASHYIKHGTRASGTVYNLLVDKGVIKSKKINKLPKKTVQKSEEEAKAAPEAQPSEAPAEEPAKEEDKEEDKAAAETAESTPAPEEKAAA